MADTKLCELLWRWSAWCETGTPRQQVVSWLKQHARTSVNASFEQDADCVEYRIESYVSALAKQDPIAAKVLRREYAVYGKNENQTSRALAMKMTLRTYQRTLRRGRDFVAAKLGL